MHLQDRLPPARILHPHRHTAAIPRRSAGREQARRQVPYVAACVSAGRSPKADRNRKEASPGRLQRSAGSRG